MKLEDVILRSTRALQPAFGTVPVGTLYFVTDESVLERNSGIVWESYSGSGGGSGTVNVDAAGALDGDGDIVTPLAVKVDGVSIGINGSNELESLGGSAVVTAYHLNVVEESTNITTGIKGIINIPVNCTIIGCRILCRSNINITIDIWKTTYATYPGSQNVSESICGTPKPTIPAGTKFEDTTLTGWNTALLAGDCLSINVDAISGIRQFTFVLIVTT